MGEPLLIVGASGRAAAASALRAGFDPFVIDLFADADTRRLCPLLRCDPAEYPHGIIPLAASAPPGPWMYTGGLENYPEVVAAISERRPLWGNGPDKLAAVRDPFAVRRDYRSEAYSIPEVLTGVAPPPPGAWLRKPLRGSGGAGITRPGAEQHAPSEHHVYQEYIPGTPVSILFVSEDRRLSVMGEAFRRWPHTIGVCVFRQLIGTPWLHARPFAYAGNLGPFGFDRYGLSAFGASVVGDMNDIRTQLTGVWGADFIFTRDEAWLVEINPRCPASVELLAYSRLNPFTWLDGCFTRPDALWKAKTWSKWPSVVGKGVYYAAVPTTLPASGPWDDSLAHCTDVWRRPDYADIPEPGTVIERGQPILTVLAEAPTEDECVAQLKRRAAGLDQLFGVPSPPEMPP